MYDISIFVHSGLITQTVANAIKIEAQKNFGGDIFSALLSHDIREEQILEVLSHEYNIPYKIMEPSAVSNDVMAYITEASAKEYNLIPLKIEKGGLEIGILDPNLNHARDAIRFISENKSVA